MTMRALVLEKPGDEPDLAVRDLPVPSAKVREKRSLRSRPAACATTTSPLSPALCAGASSPTWCWGTRFRAALPVWARESTISALETSVVTTLTTYCGRCEKLLRGAAVPVPTGGRASATVLDGGFAQYVCLPRNSFVRLPDGYRSGGGRGARLPHGRGAAGGASTWHASGPARPSW